MENNNNKKIMGIVKYVFGLIGFLGVILAILTVTGLVEEYLSTIKYTGKFDESTKLTLSLTSSIIGIFCLFIAFSNQIDKFFSFLEKHEVNKSEEKKGITLESIFFFIIAIILIGLTIALANNYLTLSTNLPLLGNATRGVLIGALIILAILALITAFNDIISQSIRETRKVQWPTGQQMWDYSIKVFSFIVFFSIFFFILDLGLTYIPDFILDLIKRIF